MVSAKPPAAAALTATATAAPRAAVLPIALLDANVLYPQFVRDLLRRLAAADLYQPRWSGRITDEWTRNVANDFGISADKLERSVGLMRQAFPDAWVTHFEPLEANFPTVHWKDRHVAAAAQKAGAAILVTRNRKDLPMSALKPYGIRRLSPDAFVAEIIASDPSTVRAVPEQHRVGLLRPPYNPRQYRGKCRQNGLRNAATLLR